MGIHDGHREKMRARFLTSGLDGFADHEALETVQIALSDHIIVADRDFVSFSESGYLSRP